MNISVITICFNNKAGLKRTLDSIAQQTLKPFELIVIDGGSTDGSVECIKQNEHIISYWVSEKDNGPYNAMNKGIERASGDFCIFMNSGDIFYSNSSLEDAETQMKDGVADLYVGVASMSDGVRETSVVKPPKEISLGFWLYHSMIHQAAFMRLSMLKEKLYDENLRIVSDWKYMFQEYTSREYRYQPLETIVCSFQIGGISSNDSERIGARAETIKTTSQMLYEEYLRNKTLKSLYYNNIQLRDDLGMILASRKLTSIFCSITKAISRIGIFLRR